LNASKYLEDDSDDIDDMDIGLVPSQTMRHPSDEALNKIESAGDLEDEDSGNEDVKVNSD